MDFKGFKKVHDDDSKAILKNKHGHAITISKKALSPKHLKGIQDLPLHAAGGSGPIPDPDPNETEEGRAIKAHDAAIDARDAEQQQIDNRNQPRKLVNNVPGTDASNQPGKTNSPVSIYIGTPGTVGTVQNPGMPSPPPPDQQPTGANPTSNTPLADAQPYSGPPQTGLAPKAPRTRAPAVGTPPPVIPEETGPDAQPFPEAQYQKTYQQAYNDSKMAHAQEAGQQAWAYQQDMANGHITPKTYADMFASKSTLGKIGSLFGLLLSGAGSGITGQPNAVLNMMNKEIDNDLEAQKTSKTNAQNFIKINQAGELNRAQIMKYYKEGLVSDAQVKNYLADTALKWTANAKNTAMLSAVNYLTGITSKLPPQSNASQLLNGVKQATDQHIQQSIDQTASALAAKDVGTEDEYVAKTQNIRNMELFGLEGAKSIADSREEHYIPSIGTTKKAVNDKAVDNIAKLKNFQNLLAEADELNKKIGAVRGRLDLLSPSERSRAGRIHSEMQSGYTDVKGLNRLSDVDLKLYDKIVPNFDVMNLTGSQSDLLEDVKKSVQNKMALEYKMGGVQPFAGGQQKSQGATSQYPDGTILKLQDGSRVKMINGKAIRQ